MSSLSDAAVGAAAQAATWPTCESGRYRFIEPIGRGGMGAVYRAYDEQLAREVAIKIPNGFGDAGVVHRLAVEARVLASLEHPGIVPIHDSGQLTDGRLFYVMKLVRGTRCATTWPACRLLASGSACSSGSATRGVRACARFRRTAT